MFWVDLIILTSFSVFVFHLPTPNRINLEMYCIGFDKQWALYLDYFGVPFQWLVDFGLSCKCLFYWSCMFILKLSLSLYSTSYWLAWWFSLSGILLFTNDVISCINNLIGFITLCLHNLMPIQCINLKILSQISMLENILLGAFVPTSCDLNICITLRSTVLTSCCSKYRN